MTNIVYFHSSMRVLNTKDAQCEIQKNLGVQKMLNSKTNGNIVQEVLSILANDKPVRTSMLKSFCNFGLLFYFVIELCKTVKENS